MDPDDYRRVKEAFGEAVGLPADEREPYLGRLDSEDRELATEVRALLGSDRGEGDPFLEPPTAPPPAQLSAVAGERRYEVVGELGRGGMGIVYLAERADGEFRQRVALKVLGPEAGAEMLTRFRAERQILASLGHPGIARLLDGGTTEDGQPFLIMEYVEGRPIHRYCDAEGLSLEERVALFGRVCRAVQHAHDHQVVHRDLKPSNILVNETGEPKLLDFGIAKLLRPEGLDWTVVETARDATVLTPRYASPEQVSGDPIGPASDVYSLGVVLYELLTGVGPYASEPTTPPELIRAISDEEPEAPDRALGRVADLNAAAEGLAKAPGARGRRRSRRELRGDLGQIVLTALRKEPGQRYASAGPLADDLERLLAGRAVAASQGAALYRAKRWLRRRRRDLVTAVVGLALLATTAALTYRWANPPPLLAQGEAARLALLPIENRTGDPANSWVESGLMEFIAGTLDAAPDIQVASPAGVRNAVRSLELGAGLDLAPEGFRALQHALGVDLVVRTTALSAGRSARMSFSLIGSDGRLGTWEVEAEDLSAAGGLLAAKLSGRLHAEVRGPGAETFYTDDPYLNRTFAKGLDELARSNGPSAERYFEICVESDPGFVRARLGLARSKILLSEWQEAERLLDVVLRTARTNADPALEADALNSLSIAARKQGRPVDAIHHAEQALAIHAERGDLRGVAEGSSALATVRFDQGRYEDAEALQRQTLSHYEELGNRQGQTETLRALGRIARWRQDFEHAAELYRRALASAREIGDRFLEARTLNSLGGMTSLDFNDYEAAAGFHEQALAIQEEIGDREGLSVSLEGLALVAARLGDPDRAIELLRERVEIARDIGAMEAVGRGLLNLSVRYYWTPDVETGESLAREALAIGEELDNLQLRWAASLNVGSFLMRRGDLAQAEGYVRAGQRLLPDNRATWRVVATFEYLNGNYSTALELMERAKDAAAGQWDEEAEDFLRIFRESGATGRTRSLPWIGDR